MCPRALHLFAGVIGREPVTGKRETSSVLRMTSVIKLDLAPC